MISCQDSTPQKNTEAYLFPLFERNKTYRKSELLHSDFGLPVMKEEFEERWNELPKTIRRSKDSEKNRKRILNRILEEKLLYREGLEKGIYKKAEIRKAILEFAKKRILKERLEQIYAAVPDPSEEEMLLFYEKNTKRFRRPAGISVDLIHFAKSPQSLEGEIMKSCRAALADLSRGRKLDEVIEQNRSVGSKAEKKRFVKKGNVPAPVWRAVSEMKQAGDLSSPIPASDGCYLARFIEKLPPGRTPFPEVKAEIQSLLLREKREKALENHVKQLKKNSQASSGN